MTRSAATGLPPPLQVPSPADFEWYRSSAAGLFNAVQPEDVFKWPSYEPSKGQYQASANYLMETTVLLAEVRAGLGLCA